MSEPLPHSSSPRLSPQRSGIILAIALALSASVAHAQTTRATPARVVLPGVPDYGWNYGCGPTAAGMLLGYWQRKDAAFYPLVDYKDSQNVRRPVPLDDHLLRSRPASSVLGPSNWNTNHGDLQIDQFIASLGHSRDYWDFTHPSEALDSLGLDPLRDHHADDSLADFLWTSRGVSRVNGLTWPWDMAPGLKNYSATKGFTPANGYTVQADTIWLPTFDQLVAEIKAGHPVLLLVDLQGTWFHMDWHFVTAYGYQDLGTPGQWIAVRDTWKDDRAYSSLPIDTLLTGGIRWWKWNTGLLHRETAIRAMTTFHLSHDPPG